MGYQDPVVQAALREAGVMPKRVTAALKVYRGSHKVSCSICLRDCYTVGTTDPAYGARWTLKPQVRAAPTVLRIPYAVSGTDGGYGGTESGFDALSKYGKDLITEARAGGYDPTQMLRHVRY